MAFCLKRKESIPKAIRRLGCEMMDESLAKLDGGATPESIHSVRKKLKKAQAVLAFTSCAIPGGERSQLKKVLKRAKDCLAEARDAQAMLAALNELLVGHHAELNSPGLKALRNELTRLCHARVQTNGDAAPDHKAVAVLRKAHKLFDSVTVERKGWKAVAPALEEVFRTCRRHCHTVQRHPTTTAFHEWRKHVKALAYFLRLLSPIWPARMRAMAAEVQELATCLGDDHDLAMLRKFAEQFFKKADYSDSAKPLRHLIFARHKALRARAIAIGRRFFAEKPSTFIARLRLYWDIWCAERSQA